MYLQEVANTMVNCIKHSSQVIVKRKFVCFGHFNARIFKLEYILHQNTSTFFRFLLCLAMTMDVKEFRAMMNKLTEYIIEVAESPMGDEIFKEYVDSQEKSKKI